MDRRGLPYCPHIHLARRHLRLEERERFHDVTFSGQKEITAPQLVNDGELARLTSGDKGHLFLTFGKAGCHRQYS